MPKKPAIRRVLLLEPLRADSDIKALHRHGEILTLFNTVCDDLPSVFETNLFITALRDRLNEFSYDPELDAFAISGRISKITIALAWVCSENQRQGFDTRVLLYDGRPREFKERVL